MAGPSWLVDSHRIATKIRSASGASDPEKVKWKSNPTRACPNCQHVIDNSDVAKQWPGLPTGVKFDPSDSEIMHHLLAKAGFEGLKSHPFIEEFIPTVDEDDGICYTHPRNLPGVKQDGSVAHFFHRAIKAYNTGTRKRRKILGDDFGDVRWHKTGKTKPVMVDGVQKGWKKIMVLYTNLVRGGKSEKTNWKMHQYHLGTEEDEKDGEFVISKIFYDHQQQQLDQGEKNEQNNRERVDATTMKADPVSPKSATPNPPRTERRSCDSDPVQDSACGGPLAQHVETQCADLDGPLEIENPQHREQTISAPEMMVDGDQQAEEESKWWDSESQNLLDSQQLVEGLSLCDEFLQSQSPNRDDINHHVESKKRILLSDYAKLGPEDLKKDLEECHNLALDPANIELDTPPDFRLSQLEFGSQDSFLAWGGSKVVD
ncbi:hypothetical protein EUGRSUZ_G02349 [Eucalyptus grandis]|uniref:Uncharacterized protein n=2 Tax=Eucalyptus grandis TaxID=71139 RepID=A0ACC3K6M9_EUCGR|nr:hypothetical protein EUGRSUZ_G02349 [Eucalyptus grandis]